MNLVVPAQAPFSFNAVARSHGWSVLAPFSWNPDTGELERVEELASGKIISFVMREAVGGVGVEVRGQVNTREARELAAKVAWMFSLDVDLTNFYKAISGEPRLAHVEQQAHGRFLRSSTVWEDVVKVMLTTNIQWSGTKRLARILVDTFGASPAEKRGSKRPGHNLRAFPTAASIARTRESRLRKIGLGYRAPYLLALARGVVSGKYDLDGLREPSLSTDDVRQALLALPGIGPYASATLLMILGRYEYLGVDTEALSSVSRGFFGGKPIGAREVQETFARWSKFKALAYWFWDWEGQFAWQKNIARQENETPSVLC